MSDELLALIEMARKVTMTPADKHAQSISFAFGSVKLTDDTITRADIERASQNIQGRPDESPPPLPLGNPPPNADLITDPALKRQQVAANVVNQYRQIVQLIGQAAGVLSITPTMLQDLHRTAIQGVYVCAGQFRQWPVYVIANGVIIHNPPPWSDVPNLIDEMCQYANSSTATPIHVAAYLMWRLNWIHPFGGGNGRTSRAVAYLALCVRLGFVLPGNPTIPEQIKASYRNQYCAALSKADQAWAAGRLDLADLESLISALLVNQLISVYTAAGGVIPQP